MNLINNIEIVDLALYLHDTRTLIISDTQLGYEENLNQRGILLPTMQYPQLVERLSKIFAKIKPKTVIINGDIKHDFGAINKTEWRNVLKLIDFLKSKVTQIILVKGNHDTMLEPIAKKREIKVVDYFLTSDIYVCHGHQIPDDNEFSKSKTIIIGHEHPAITLKDSGRSEKYKCFLKGKFKKKMLIVQPSLNLITQGTDVLSEKLLSPFLRDDIKNFDVYVVSDEILHFGKIKTLMKHN